jgi:hypothetical protein
VSAALLDELLAGFAGPGAELHAVATGAKAANSAKQRVTSAEAPAAERCETLRMSANVPWTMVGVQQDSQDFAAVRSGLIDAQVMHPCGSSQLSQGFERRPRGRARAGAWTRADVSNFLDRRARMLRWGWTVADAERLAERLVFFDREHDARVSCADCTLPNGSARQPHLCTVTIADVGTNLAVLLQHCPGRNPKS